MSCRSKNIEKEDVKKEIIFKYVASMIATADPKVYYYNIIFVSMMYVYIA